MSGIIDASSMAGPDAGARIAAAVAALGPEGGVVDARGLVPSLTSPISFPCEINATITIDRPVQLLLGAANYLVKVSTRDLTTGDVTGAFAVLGVNFSVTGIHRGTTTIKCDHDIGGPIFVPSGVWKADTGSFILERLTLDGNSATAWVLDWPSHSPAVDENGNVLVEQDFQDGLLLVQDCVIQNFWWVAFTIGRSVYLCVVRDCYFYNNHGSMFIDKDSDARIDDNFFVQAGDVTAQLAIVGPDVRIAGNIFNGAPIGDTSTRTDIQIVPTSAGPGKTSADGSGFDGGYIWILDNKFGPENESLNPKRRRILARDQNLPSDRGLLCAPVIIRGNFILGPPALQIISILPGMEHSSRRLPVRTRSVMRR
jgi:hypothetical protein